MSDPLTITSDDGLALEAVLDAPPDPRGALVLCHPHPSMGGTMNAPLLLAVRDRAVADGWSVLRFNFRGIGRSAGASSDGVAETADARAGLAAMTQRFPEQPLALAGWSFGAAVAARVAAERDDLAGCVAIAPAVRPRPGVSAGIPDGLDIAAPVLVVCGANDEQVSPEACRRWAESLSDGRYVAVNGANHFFWARYDRLTEIVAGFLGEVRR